MPGINYVLADTVTDEEVAIAAAEMKHLEHIEVETVFRSGGCALLFAGYDGYPSLRKETGRWVVFLEGMIYNRSDEDILGALEAITERFLESVPADDLIRDFVEGSDGDYVAVCLDKRTSAALFFNDRYGRLPLQHFFGEGRVIVARESVFMFRMIPSLEVDRIGLAQFMMFEFTLGTRMLFKRVFRQSPAHSLAVRPPDGGGGPRVDSSCIVPLRFGQDAISAPRETLVGRQYHLLLESVRNRYETCRRKGFKITELLSGGLDSRGVLLGLRGIGAKAEIFTGNQFTADESAIAFQLADKYGCPVNVIPASRELDLEEMADQVYRTGCTVNGVTTQTCWRDSAGQRRMAGGGPIASFGGQFGEASRASTLPTFGSRSLYQMFLAHSTRIRVCPESAAILAGIAPEILLTSVKEHFEGYPEQSLVAQTQRYLFELFRHSGDYGEDRHRLFYWCVQPFAGKDMCRFAFEELPFRLTGNGFFVDVLRRIDPEALNVPYYGSRMRLNSRFSVGYHDLRKKSRYLLKSMLMRWHPTRKYIFTLERHHRSRFHEQCRSALFETLGSLSALKSYISPESVLKFLEIDADTDDLFRVLSVLYLFRELERRFPGKLICSEPVV